LPDRFALVKLHLDGSGPKLIARLPFSPRFIDWVPTLAITTEGQPLN
jgi:hypothetical protein